MIACLAEEIAPEEVEELALGIAAWRDQLDNTDDTTVVFRDSAFSNDVAKTNCTEILRQRSIESLELRVPGDERWLQPDEAYGSVDNRAVQREMIRKAIREQLSKEKRLHPQGIQVLTLFFIDKERLLSFDKPLKFIFSHSALREGWIIPTSSKFARFVTFVRNGNDGRLSVADCACASTRTAKGNAGLKLTR